jgi:hypothetical protein
MNKLDVPEKYFDLIWSEGAIYFKGYENALRDWKKYFRDRIRFAFTEANWFENDVPDGARRVWEEYPLTGIEETLRRIRNLGYDVKWFKLPTESWSINYYKPLQTALDAYCKSAPLSGAAKTVTASIQQEIDDYAKYFRYYGYTFYICEEKATG